MFVETQSQTGISVTFLKHIYPSAESNDYKQFIPLAER